VHRNGNQDLEKMFMRVFNLRELSR